MTELRVWAPRPRLVRLSIDGNLVPMHSAPDGWWTADIDLKSGTDYGFVLNDEDTVLPDPESRWQPYGVHGVSRSYDQSAFEWTDSSWSGRDLPGSVIYELHVGTFTPGGTFDAAIERLDHLVDLGITHVEVLPVNAVNGVWNWGYDGVGWYAVHEPYGGPDGLKRFVDACHARGLAIILDVVYNHLGPSGNYLPRYGPYLKDGSSEWGALVNLDGPGSDQVRRYIIDNALMWFTDFHVDALRLDAVHALQDDSTPHLLTELSAEVDALTSRLGRAVILIAESDLNDPLMVTPREAGGRGMHAQWDDDVHHALHALVTGERRAYYSDFGSLDVLAKVLTSAFLHDGSYSTFRGRRHGRAVDRELIPGYRFVACIQNHDQVGNREAGERLSALATPALHRVAAVLLLTSAFTPMLWMGEEWAADTPWPYFTSHPEPELDRIAINRRVKEFDGHGWDFARMLDPQDPATFERAVLNWDELDQPMHRETFTLYRSLIALRRAEVELSDPRLDQVRADYDEGRGWIIVHRGQLVVVANVAAESTLVPVEVGEILLATGEADFDRTGLRIGAQTAVIARAR